jgi:hypothetical protein
MRLRRCLAWVTGIFHENDGHGYGVYRACELAYIDRMEGYSFNETYLLNSATELKSYMVGRLIILSGFITSR